jgi:hypothetical protein
MLPRQSLAKNQKPSLRIATSFPSMLYFNKPRNFFCGFLFMAAVCDRRTAAVRRHRRDDPVKRRCLTEFVVL